MKLRHLFIILLAAVVAPSCGLIGGKKLEDAMFSPKGISVTTVATGETTSIYGTKFGDERGDVFVGDTQAQVVSWNDRVVRIKVPRVPEERYDVNVQPPGCKKKYAGKIAVRDALKDGLYDWVDGDVAGVDSSEMEPLVMVIKPVGPPMSGLFDFEAPISKSRDELLEEIEWAYIQGVQMVQLYFPARVTTGADGYADVSMQNIRYMVEEVGKRCPGMMIDIDSTYLPDGNARLARLLPMVTNEAIYNIGSFEPAPERDLRLTGITDADRAGAEIAESLSFYKHPIPYIMTTWQAYDIKNFAQGGTMFPEPRTAILSMALDHRTVDTKKAYNDIKNLLPPGTRTIAATNLVHVSEILGYAISQGDHLAFGFHYSKYWPGSSENYISNNLFLVEKALLVAEKIHRPIAPLEEAAGIIGVVPIPAATDANLKVVNKTSGGARNTYIKSKRGRGRISVLNGLPSNNVTDLTTSFDGQELWALTSKGLYASEDRGETFGKVNIRARKSFHPTDIATTANGNIWLASPGYGIYMSANYGKSYDTFTVDSGALLGDHVTSLHSYGDEIFACTYRVEKGLQPAGTGIGYTTNGGKDWHVWISRDGLPYDDCRTVYVEDAAVFVGFGGLSEESDASGLGVSDDFGETWLLAEGIEAPVLSIAAWHDNTLIVGTKGAGAFNVRYNGSMAEKIAEVPETAIVSDITIDGRGWLWLVTDSGILVSDSKSGPFRKLTVDDGVGSPKITGGAYAGEMFFSTTPEEEFAGGLTKIVVAEQAAASEDQSEVQGEPQED
ncbi:IPT/TIG domain-containing protein [bacterium]